MKKIKVYLAAGFFNDNQNSAVDYIESFLDNSDSFEVFSPRRETKLSGSENNEAQKKVFDENLYQVRNADLVVCSTVDKDMGAIFEAAVAYENDIPIIYTLFDKRFEQAVFNLMLAQSGIACFTDKDKFEAFMNILNPDNLRQTTVDYEGEFE